MVYRLESPLVSLGLPDVLAQVMSEVLTHEEMREILQVDIFSSTITKIGQSYRHSEEMTTEREKDLDRFQGKINLDRIKQGMAQRRIDNLKFCKTMLLNCIKNAQGYVTSMAESRVRIGEIEREFEAKIASILGQRNG